jgi:hypothetical protein
MVNQTLATPVTELVIDQLMKLTIGCARAPRISPAVDVLAPKLAQLIRIGWLVHDFLDLSGFRKSL